MPYLPFVKSGVFFRMKTLKINQLIGFTEQYCHSFGLRDWVSVIAQGDLEFLIFLPQPLEC